MFSSNDDKQQISTKHVPVKKKKRCFLDISRLRTHSLDNLEFGYEREETGKGGKLKLRLLGPRVQSRW